MVDEHDANDSTGTNKNTNSINRRRFVKGLGAAGGVALAGNLAVSTAQATTSTSVDTMAVDELDSMSRTIAKKADIENLTGTGWQDNIQNGDLKSRDAGYQESSGTNKETFPKYEITTSGSDLSVSGRSQDGIPVVGKRHKLDNGNEMVAMVYGVGDNEILAYYEYEEVEDDVKSKAELWDITVKEDDSELTLKQASYNGEVARPISDVGDTEVSSEEGGVSTQNNACGGCNYGGGPGQDNGDRPRASCRATNNLKCAFLASGCVGCGGACVLGSLGASCAFCLFSTCSGALANCCGDTKQICVACA